MKTKQQFIQENIHLSSIKAEKKFYKYWQNKIDTLEIANIKEEQLN